MDHSLSYILKQWRCGPEWLEGIGGDVNQSGLVECGYREGLVMVKTLEAISLPSLSGGYLFHIPSTFQYEAVMHSV